MCIYSLNMFLIVFKRKIYLPNGGLILIFTDISNVWLAGDVLIQVFWKIPFIYKVCVWLYFHSFIIMKKAWIDPYVELHFSELSFGITFEIEVDQLRCLIWLFKSKRNFRVIITHIWCTISFEFMFPHGNRFSVVLLKVLSFVVDKLTMVILNPNPADHLSFLKVMDGDGAEFPPVRRSLWWLLLLWLLGVRTEWGAPLFLAFQVNQPYFSIVAVRNYKLILADHLKRHMM